MPTYSPPTPAGTTLFSVYQSVSAKQPHQQETNNLLNKKPLPSTSKENIKLKKPFLYICN
jgi:hypothetical protein